MAHHYSDGPMNSFPETRDPYQQECAAQTVRSGGLTKGPRASQNLTRSAEVIDASLSELETAIRAIKERLTGPMDMKEPMGPNGIGPNCLKSVFENQGPRIERLIFQAREILEVLG